MSDLNRNVTCAAKWWTDRLRDGRGVGLNGDDSRAGGNAYAMAQAHRICVTDEQIAAFESSLRTRIIAAFADRESPMYRDPSGNDDLCIATDYGPDALLAHALNEASICGHSMALPWKTVMRVSSARVMVAHGYGAPFVNLAIDEGRR